jgi:hypothetical protein
MTTGMPEPQATAEPPVPPALAKLEELLSHPQRRMRLLAAQAVVALTLDGIEAKMPAGLRHRWEDLLALALEVRGQKQVAKNLRIGKWEPSSPGPHSALSRTSGGVRSRLSLRTWTLKRTSGPPLLRPMAQRRRYTTSQRRPASS